MEISTKNFLIGYQTFCLFYLKYPYKVHCNVLWINKEYVISKYSIIHTFIIHMPKNSKYKIKIKHMENQITKIIT